MQNFLTKRSNKLQFQISKAVESTFEEALEAKYFKFNNGRISAMFNVVEQALAK